MVLGLVRRALVVGGAGALGRVMVTAFRANWDVTNIDITYSPNANLNIVLYSDDPRSKQIASATSRVQGKFDAILCVAGGFTMGSPADPNIFEQCKKMMEANVFPSLLAAHLATKHLDDLGLLMFTGAAGPFKAAAPGMCAYSMAKNTVHSLALNMASRTDISSVSTVLTILPTMIDTPANRKAMPDADKSTWLTPEGITKLVKGWAEGSHRPENGSFLVLKNEKGAVVPEFV